METRDLYLVAIVIASVSGGYYYYSGSAQKIATDKQNMTYAAKGIVLTQSDEHGKLYLRATVDAVQQNIQNKSSNLQNLAAQMYKAGQVDATFQAQQGEGINDNSSIVLKGGVVATKQTLQGPMRFETEQLRGDPKSRVISTDLPVRVIYPRAEFVSQGLKANLDNGQYEFFNIRGKYAPKS